MTRKIRCNIPPLHAQLANESRQCQYSLAFSSVLRGVNLSSTSTQSTIIQSIQISHIMDQDFATKLICVSILYICIQSLVFLNASVGEAAGSFLCLVHVNQESYLLTRDLLHSVVLYHMLTVPAGAFQILKSCANSRKLTKSTSSPKDAISSIISSHPIDRITQTQSSQGIKRHFWLCRRDGEQNTTPRDMAGVPASECSRNSFSQEIWRGRQQAGVCQQKSWL